MSLGWSCLYSYALPTNKRLRGQYHTYDKPILVTLMHVAQALAANLGIAKPSSEDSTHKMLNYSARGCPKSVTYTERTMHERRALLGFFFISSE